MAHYLEHLLFKGTTILGTSDYQKEKPLLDSIHVLYD
jgi:predicted Zn-dependent peptidase